MKKDSTYLCILFNNKSHIFYYFIYMKNPEKANLFWRIGGGVGLKVIGGREGKG